MLSKTEKALGCTEPNEHPTLDHERPFAYTSDATVPIVIQVKSRSTGTYEDLKWAYLPESGDIEWGLILEFAEAEEAIRRALSSLGHTEDEDGIRTVVGDNNRDYHECGPALSELLFRRANYNDLNYGGRQWPERITLPLILAMMRAHRAVIAAESAATRRDIIHKELLAVERAHGVTDA